MIHTQNVSQNSIWRIHYGERKVDKLSDFDENCILRVLRVVEYDSVLRFSKRTLVEEKLKKISNVQKIWYMGIFGVAYYNSTTSLQNSTWPIEYGGLKAKNYPILKKIGILRFFGVAKYESVSIFLKFKIADPI